MAFDFSVVLDEPIDPKNKIGKGQFGAVYNVKLKGAVCIAKRLHDILTGARGEDAVAERDWKSIVAKFQSECALLSKLRHPNVVQFLGTYRPTRDPRDLVLVMEKLNMDLKQFMMAHPKAQLPIKLSILRDVSCGLLYIHSHGIVHRDLNAGNVLLTHSLQAKVADLGVARTMGPRQFGELTQAPGAQDYMPPEALNENPKYEFSLDVFSLGHLSLYLINGIYPRPYTLSIHDIQLPATHSGIVMGLEAQRRKRWLDKMEDHALSGIVVRCLQDDPKHRPTMAELNKEIEKHCDADPVTALMVGALLNPDHQKELNKLTAKIDSLTKSSQKVQEQLETMAAIIQEKEGSPNSEESSSETSLVNVERLIQLITTLQKEKDAQVRKYKEIAEEKESKLNVSKNALDHTGLNNDSAVAGISMEKIARQDANATSKKSQQEPGTKYELQQAREENDQLLHYVAKLKALYTREKNEFDQELKRTNKSLEKKLQDATSCAAATANSKTKDLHVNNRLAMVATGPTLQAQGFEKDKKERAEKLNEKPQTIKNAQKLQDMTKEWEEERNELEIKVNELNTKLKSEQNSKSHFQSAFEQMRAQKEQLDVEFKRIQTANSTLKTRLQDADEEVKHLKQVLQGTYEGQGGPVNYQAPPVVHMDHLQPQQPHPQQHADNSTRPSDDQSMPSYESCGSDVSVNDPPVYDQEQMMEMFRRKQQEKDMAEQREMEQKRMEQQRYDQQRMEQQRMEAAEEQERIEWERQHALRQQGRVVDEQAQREANEHSRMRQSQLTIPPQPADSRSYAYSQRPSLSAGYDHQYHQQQYYDNQQGRPSPAVGDRRPVDERPYDPNLVCPKCGKRYRIGEIQRLRHHVLEECSYREQ